MRTIPISRLMIDAATERAATENRSLTEQIEFWVRLGKCAEANPDLPVSRIKELLVLAENFDKDLKQSKSNSNVDTDKDAISAFLKNGGL